jgi:2-polyprenyl-6-methoxyphenol hydroxylase-like FAD-dependent oxidoreductase
MVVGPSGYVGICETDGGFLDLAAALNPSEIRRQGSIGRCIQGILQECQFHLNIDVTQEQWSATPLLTRDSLTVAMRGVYLLGDSAGYVEPFTGEGMSWALAGAESLAAILSRSTDPARSPTRESDWTHWVSRHRRAKQSISKWVAKQARNTQRANLCLRLLDWTPPIRNFLVRKAMQ